MMHETMPLQPSLAPDTTHQQDLTTKGQRDINRIWEWTQSLIALMVVVCSCGLAIHGAVTGTERPMSQTLSNMLFLIIGFYFSRTNHAAIGGMGHKANSNQEYKGR